MASLRSEAILVLILNPRSGLGRRHEAIASADRRYLQVQRRMLRMPALVQQRLIGFFAGEDGHKHRTLRMVLAKVITKSALSAMNCLHNFLLPLSLRVIPAARRCLDPAILKRYSTQKFLVNCDQ